MRLSLNKFAKEYCIEIFYLLLITFSYIFISSVVSTYIKSAPQELISLIKRIPSAKNSEQYWVITETNPNTVKKILNTNNVLSIDSVVNIDKPEHFAQAFNMLRKRYKVPLYLIVRSKSQDFNNIFTSANLDFPFKKVYEYETIDESYSLYLFNPKD